MKNENEAFQLIDLDRTLFNTSHFAKVLTEEINKSYPGVGSRLDEMFETAYQKGETFFLLRYLREFMGDEAFEKLVQQLVAREGEDAFWLPGAKERLVLAEEISSLESPAWGILTYGDEVDQQMKRTIIGLQNAPMLLTDTPDKAEVIRGWKTDDGRFTLPRELGGLAVDVLTLEDDKLRAFKDLPDGVHGVWVATGHGTDQKIPDELIGKVTAVSDLYASMEHIKRILS